MKRDGTTYFVLFMQIYKYSTLLILMPKLKMEGKHEALWVTISSDEYESLKATIETLSDIEVMEQLRKSEEDIRIGRTRSWDEFVNEFRRNKSELYLILAFKSTNFN